jgi:hypothetical protein
MKPSEQYQQCYEKLFVLVMQNQWHSDEAKDLRKEMDRLFPKLPGRCDEERMRFVMPRAMELYNTAVGNVG